MWFTVALVGGALLTVRLIVWPYTSPVERADAVFVLAGDDGDRLQRGLELMGHGVAPTLVLDGQAGSPAVAALCLGDQAFEVVCLEPEPDSTRTEAETVGALAVKRRWQTLIVVTSRSHTTRAGLLLRRCVPGRVSTVGTGSRSGYGARFHAIRHELLGLVDALILNRTC